MLIARPAVWIHPWIDLVGNGEGVGSAHQEPGPRLCGHHSSSLRGHGTEPRQQFLHDFFEAIERPVEIVPCDDKRRRQSDGGVMGFFGQYALGKQALAHQSRASDLRVEFGANPEPAPAHLLQRRAADRPQSRKQVSTELAATLHQAFITNDLKRLKPDCCGYGVAAKGRTMRARREHVHDVLAADKCRHRQNAAAQRLAQNESVRADVFMLIRKPGAGPAETRLHLVEDQNDTPGVADPPHARQPTLRRHDDASFALNGFDEHGSGVGTDRALHSGKVAERNRAESWREWSKAVAIIRLGGKANDCRCAAMEISLSDYDLGLIACNFFYAISPPPRGLDCRLS